MRKLLFKRGMPRSVVRWRERRKRAIFSVSSSKKRSQGDCGRSTRSNFRAQHVRFDPLAAGEAWTRRVVRLSPLRGWRVRLCCSAWWLRVLAHTLFSSDTWHTPLMRQLSRPPTSRSGSYRENRARWLAMCWKETGSRWTRASTGGRVGSSAGALGQGFSMSTPRREREWSMVAGNKLLCIVSPVEIFPLMGNAAQSLGMTRV